MCGVSYYRNCRTVNEILHIKMVVCAVYQSFFFSSRWLGWIFYSSEATLIWNECFLPFVWPERTKFGGESVLNQWKLFVSFDYFSIFIKFAYFIFLNTFDSNHFHLSIRWRKNCFNSFGKFKNDRKKNTLLTTQRESR